MELAKNHSKNWEAYTMISIAEIFDNSKQLLDSITGFVDKYIGCSLLRKCGIRKIVDDVKKSADYEYCDNPIYRLIGDPNQSKVLEKIISARQLLTDKLVVCFASASACLMFKTDIFFRDYKKDTFYIFFLSMSWYQTKMETVSQQSLFMQGTRATAKIGFASSAQIWT